MMGRAMTMLRTPTTRSAPLPVFRAADLRRRRYGARGQRASPGRPGRAVAVSGAAAVLLFAVGLGGTGRPRSLGAVCCERGGGDGLHVWLSATHSRRELRARPWTWARTHSREAAHGTWPPERLHDSAAMTVLHAVAAVLVAVLLHRADAACWSLARGLTGAVDAVGHGSPRRGPARALRCPRGAVAGAPPAPDGAATAQGGAPRGRAGTAGPLSWARSRQ